MQKCLNIYCTSYTQYTATVWAIQASVSIGEASRTSYRYDLLNVINKSYALRCCSGEVRLLREVELLGQLRNVSY